MGVGTAFRGVRAAGWPRGGGGGGDGAGALPRMYSVQSSGCAPVVKAFEERLDRCTPWPEPWTVASGLRVPGPFGDRLMLRALRESGGGAVAGADEALPPAARGLQTRERIGGAPGGRRARAAAV